MLVDLPLRFLMVRLSRSDGVESIATTPRDTTRRRLLPMRVGADTLPTGGSVPLFARRPRPSANRLEEISRRSLGMHGNDEAGNACAATG